LRSLTSHPDQFRVADAQSLLTPALVINSDNLKHNIARMLDIVGGADFWRPHIKTAKLAYTIRQLVGAGVRKMKCATTLELSTACEAGASDVLVAFPVLGANARRVAEIAERHPGVQVSALIEHEEHIRAWKGSRVSVFLDLNPGMDRTGAELRDPEAVIAIAGCAARQGVRFRGLHYYDGHLSQPDFAARTAIAHRGYDQLMQLVPAFTDAGHAVEEVITSGTPALPCALSYAPFRTATFQHTVSPGTVLYNDVTSLGQLPEDYDLRLAVLLVSTVVSHPKEGVVTCDAGHKSMPVDCGVPNCMVLGCENIEPLRPSEEHLPLRIPPGLPSPAIGDRLYLVPRHVCPMINNFNDAVIVSNGEIVSLERVTARGHEAPLVALKTGARP
jgi:D-serine deaminase-like pyridoxal phosphate-dependent protein